MRQSNVGTLTESVWVGGLVSFLTTEIRAHFLVYALILSLLTETVIVSWFVDAPLTPFLVEYLNRALTAGLLLLDATFLTGLAYALVQRKEPSPLRFLKVTITRIWSWNVFPRCVYAGALLSLFAAAFLYNKKLIPELNPFAWDATFAEWDRLLFGGSHPWQLLHPFLANPPATIFLDIVYASWIPLVFICWCLVFVSPRVSAELRYRYLLATVASWIFIGLVLATAFSSAGPCYFGDMLPQLASPYAGLNDYLASIHSVHPLGSTLTKQYLWDIYSGGYDIPGGISAMPSMHNAQAVLFAAAAYGVNRWLGHIMLAYAVVIFTGSIHLAWHYAIDGMAGALCALLIWWVAGAVVKRHRSWMGITPS